MYKADDKDIVDQMEEDFGKILDKYESQIPNFEIGLYLGEIIRKFDICGKDHQAIKKTLQTCIRKISEEKKGPVFDEIIGVFQSFLSKMDEKPKSYSELATSCSSITSQEAKSEEAITSSSATAPIRSKTPSPSP